MGITGRDKCAQLRGLLHSQEAQLKIEESKNPRDEREILKLKTAIDNTHRKLEENGCS